MRTLRLRGVDVAALPALLPALRPPAAGSLERLILDELRSGDDASVAAAALHACVPHLESIGELELSRSFCAGEVQQALLPQLPRLHTLRLTNCGLAALPAGIYLSGAGGLLCLVCGRQTIGSPLSSCARSAQVVGLCSLGALQVQPGDILAQLQAGVGTAWW